MVERVEGMADDVRALELMAGLGENARAVERDIPVADYRRVTAAEKWIVAAVQIGPSGLCGIMST